MPPIPESDPPSDLEDEVKPESTPQSESVEHEVEEEVEELNEEQEQEGSEEPRVNGHDEEEDEDDEDEDGDGSPKGRKRARVSEDGSSRVVKDEVRPRQAVLVRNDDGYVTGSIVRVALKNFMTYDNVEFRPGPYLNMVLGPNGTGKSSIASAICLGLGYSPAVLNRAGNLKDFVKHGHDGGWIELELKGQPGKKNVVIRRTLVMNGNASVFTMNGKSVPQKEVKTAVANLNVQVDNLCAFLPQDRVSEFAQLTPQQLLVETQKAAGEAKLTEWHQKLIEYGVEYEKKLTELEGYKKEVEHLRQSNSTLEHEVERFRRRRIILDNIALLELQIPFARYAVEKAIYDVKRAEHRRIGEELKKLAEEDSPLMEFKKELEDQKKKLSEERKAVEEDARLKAKALKQKHDASQKEEDKAVDATDRLRMIRKNEAERRDRVTKLERTIESLEAIVGAGPPDVTADLNAVNEKQERIREQHLALTEEKLAQQARHKEAMDRSAFQKERHAKASRELSALDDRAERQLSALGKWDRDCADAIKWLRQNGDKFSMEVIEPPMVSLTVRDPRYTDQIESLFGANQIKTFVCQCQEDANTLNRWINDTQDALHRKARINVWFRPVDLDRLPPPPLRDDQIQALGFDGYAIDFVDGPPALSWYLQRELHLHRTAIALKDNNIDTGAAAKALSANTGANFIAGKTAYQVSRSQYGKRETFQVTRDVLNARNLANHGVDPNEKKRLIEERAQATQALEDNEASVQEAFEEGRAIKERENALKKVKAELEDEKNRIKKVLTDYNTNRLALNTNKNKLDIENRAPSADAERATLKGKLMDHARTRTRLALEYTDILEKLVDDYEEMSRLSMDLAQTMSNISYLERLDSEKNENRERLNQAYGEAHDAYLVAKHEANQILHLARRLRDEAPQELKDRQDAVKDEPDSKNLELLEQKLQDERTNLDMNLVTNESVVRKYERQKAEMERLEKIIADREASNARAGKKMKEIKDRWYPALQELVTNINEKFSDAFQRIGCVGEVKIGEHTDYAQWSIDIWVKFRDSEQLQRLTGQRQSGGERALTTIFYLMSLTELARAPFSLVDEINQGMDQRYERAVHNNLVEVTCRDNSGQYFLITPKLLPNLTYHERMKILCVNNGEWLNEAQNGKTYGNMRRMLEHRKYYPIQAAAPGSPAVSVH